MNVTCVTKAQNDLEKINPVKLSNVIVSLVLISDGLCLKHMIIPKIVRHNILATVNTKTSVKHWNSLKKNEEATICSKRVLPIQNVDLSQKKEKISMRLNIGMTAIHVMKSGIHVLILIALSE